MGHDNWFSLLLLFLSISVCACLFSNPLKKLKQKAKDAYKKKFGRGKTWHFLGFDLAEYPGTNEKYRQMNREKWDEYYKCLGTQDRQHDISVTPLAMLGFTSRSIQLECPLCLSPEETSKIDSVEWDYVSQDGKKFRPVELTENVLVTAEDRSLHIYNLQTEHTGQYVCRIEQEIGTPYFLTVKDSPDEIMREVHPEEAPTGPYPEERRPILGYDLVLETEWLPWSPCSKCDQIGKKYRLGYCIVLFEQSSAKTNETTEELIEIQKEDYGLLQVFKFGIPCASHILPRSISKLPQIRERKNEIMAGFCKVSCPEDKVFEVRDKDGNVIEKANNSAGVYSMLQGVPPAEPNVERELQFAVKGKEAVITCPGNLNSDIPVEWQMGSKKIIPELIVTESNGRIYVSVTDKIHIKDCKVSDSNMYSCWQHKDLAGTVRLVVEKRLSLDFNHHLMLIGCVLISSVFIYVYARVFLGRKYVQMAKK